MKPEVAATLSGIWAAVFDFAGKVAAPTNDDGGPRSDVGRDLRSDHAVRMHVGPEPHPAASTGADYPSFRVRSGDREPFR